MGPGCIKKINKTIDSGPSRASFIVGITGLDGRYTDSRRGASDDGASTRQREKAHREGRNIEEHEMDIRLSFVQRAGIGMGDVLLLVELARKYVIPGFFRGNDSTSAASLIHLIIGCVHYQGVARVAVKYRTFYALAMFAYLNANFTTGARTTNYKFFFFLHLCFLSPIPSRFWSARNGSFTYGCE
jgi:hypothetical protein